MADKILKIKLEVDTTDTGKFAKVTQDLGKSVNEVSTKTERLKQLEKERLDLLGQQQVSLAKLQATVSNLNSLQEKGSLNSRLALNAANTSVLNYNKSLEANLKLQQQIQQQQSGLKGGFNFKSASTSAVPRNVNTPVDGTRARNPLTGQIIQSEEELANKIAKLKEGISRSSNAILEQQTKDRLNREVEAARLAQQKITNAQSFAQRLNSTPRVASQGSQIDITGALSRHLKSQALAHTEAEKAAKAHDKALQELDGRHKNMITRIVEAVSIYRVYNATLNTIINSIKAIPDIGIQLETTKSVLAATVGTEASVASVLASLNKEAERTGIAVSVLRESFRTFNASALLAGESTETAYRIFTNLNTTITSLHLSADLAQHTFLAFSQILNKGKVQSEELVKQLGNLLPGAFATMAKALGISTQELSKRMKAGLVTAHDSLDAFAAEYARQFKDSFIVAQQGLNANIGRMQTSFTLLGESIYAQTSGAMVDFVKGLTSITNEFRAVIEGTSKWNTELDYLKKTIETIVFISIAAGISNIATKLVALAGNTALATAGLAKLKSAFSFLSVPTAIVAGILLIADRLKEVISPADTLIDKLRKSREEAEALAEQNTRRANLTQPEQIKFDAENSAEVKAKFKQVKELGEQIELKKQELANNKFNPFYGVNDTIRAKDFISEGTKELKLQIKEYENLLNAKKLQIETDQIAAKAKEGTFAPKEEIDKSKKEKAIKEVNFSEEIGYQNALIKKETERYKARLETLKLTEKELEIKLKENAISANPVADSAIKDKISNIKSQALTLEQEHEKTLLEIARKSENIIVGSVKKTTISVQQAFAKIQDIESLGVGNRDKAVSITGALGKSQVQPSTLSEYTQVPQRILDIEKQARFKLNKLGLKNTLSGGERKELEAFAESHIKEINQAGEALFSKLVKQFDGDFIKAAVAYNTGAARVKIASEAAKQAGRADFESFLPTTGKLALNKRGLAEAQGYAKKARSAIGGQQFDPAILDQQTKQQEALDKVRSIGQEKYLLAQEEELQRAERIKQVKEEEVRLGIELLESGDQTREAELAKIRAEFTERYAEAERLGSEFLKRRLPILEQAKVNQVELKTLQDKYNENERSFNQQVQEYTNKSLVGKLKNYQAAQAIVDLQAKYIEQQSLILKEELKVAATEEQRVDINEKLNALKQRQIETASFNQNFTSSPERQQFENNDVNINASKQASLDLLVQEQEAGLVSYEQFQQRKSEIENKYIQASMLNNTQYYSGVFGVASENFAGITKAAQMMFGEQSTAARAAFAAQKGFAVAQATMQTYVAATKAYSEGGPYLGPALAAIAVAAGLANVAQIISQPMPSGAAHGGLENVPKEQTYLLDKGERVLSPKQNVDITNKVTNIHDKMQGNSGGNVKVINVVDPGLLNSYLNTEEGERVIMNVVKRNS